MRRSASEKMEIIRIVQDSELGVKQTLEELGISRSTFYVWYKHYFEDGFDGLTPKSPNRKSFWNEIPKKEKNKVIEIALEKEDLSPRELACHITDEKGWFISESSVYRILKERGLVTSPKWILMAAADEFKDKTSRIHQQWQTDFTYFKIIGWGWYYLATIMDDYSRYIIHWELCSNMESSDAMRVVGQALKITRLTEKNRPRLLTDNGSCYVSSAFKEFIQQQKMGHVQGAPYHPQTQGKIERYHRTMKNVVKLENYYFPEELRTRLAEFVDYYNNHRYHESLGNVTPASVYLGRQNEVFNRRKEIKIETIKERREMNQKKQLKQLLKY